jgi:hypothetical protein
MDVVPSYDRDDGSAENCEFFTRLFAKRSEQDAQKDNEGDDKDERNFKVHSTEG